MVRKSTRNVSKVTEKSSTDSPKRRSGRSSRRKKVSSSESEDDIRETSSTILDKVDSGIEKKSPERKKKPTRSLGTKDTDQTKLQKTSESKDDSSVCEVEEEKEEIKYKGKSKSKNKSISETSSQIEHQIENENVQVTSQSPPNDNESVVQNVAENINDHQGEDSVIENNSQDVSVQDSSVADDSTTCENSIANETEVVEACGQNEVASQSVLQPATIDNNTAHNDAVRADDSFERSHTPPVRKSREATSFTPDITQQDADERENQGIVQTEINILSVQSSQETPEESLNTNNDSSNQCESQISIQDPEHPGMDSNQSKNVNEDDSTEKTIDSSKFERSNDNKHIGRRISLRRNNDVKPVDEKEPEKTTRRKITLRRSQDTKLISAEEKKDVNEIPSETTEATISELNEKEKESQQDGWSSVYEKQSTEQEDTSKELSSRKIISLKRQSVSEDNKQNPTEPELNIENHNKQKRRNSSTSEKSKEDLDKPMKPFRKIKIKRNVSIENSTEDQKTPEGELPDKQPRTRGFRWITESSVTVPKVDIELLKTVCPNLKFPSENEVNFESIPKSTKIRKVSENSERITTERKASIETDEESEKPLREIHKSEDETAEMQIETNPGIIAMNRKISIVDDTASKMRPPPSPAKNPVSDVLFITNLVRPFTIKQLKELLERTGKIKEDGFWTDRIKSKCYVHYESAEESEATRNALHGVNWPIGNGKKLIIDYATSDDMEKAKKPPVPVKTEKTPEKENKKPELDLHENDKKKEGHVREWDAGKEDYQRQRSRTRSRERTRKHSRRSYTPEGDYHSKKRKHEEPIPQKVMDDLFLKTKATPSIYWQPLSPEEIAMKQQQRLVRMEEHKRRLEETRTRRDIPFRGSTFRRR